MFNWFTQQARELTSPTVQMGQPIVTDSSVTAVKKKKIDDEAEVTEEGFVCVGRSSFYSPMEHQAVSFNYSQSSSTSNHRYPPYPPGTGGLMYPELPSPATNHINIQRQESASSEPLYDALKQIPFVLRNDLRPLPPRIYDPMRSSIIGRKTTIDWMQFEYDFELERSVIREVRQHYANR